MQKSDTVTTRGEDLSAEDQFFTVLPLARLMIESGIKPCPGLGLFEFDATVLLAAHSAGRLTLKPELLRAVIRISRGEDYRPNRALRREIEAKARSLLNKSTEILNAMLPRARDAGAAQ